MARARVRLPEDQAHGLKVPAQGEGVSLAGRVRWAVGGKPVTWPWGFPGEVRP
ncbi:hypothetical protein [Thermus neutrinimicus]|uniref:hypothetical protein n=1 Tax=Thermus neutrinimicus TaxID=2908149 RepID=UPI001FAB2247|nr:hypothetical protein [Thermus neutrinimicus]